MHHFPTDGWTTYMRSVWKKVENALLHRENTSGQVPNENSVSLSLNIFVCVIYFCEACWWPSTPRWTHHLLARWSLSAADRWEVLWRSADRVAARGGMGSICISVWDPDSSGFSLQPDLLHICLTVYCPPPRLTLIPLYASIISTGPHTHVWHTQTQIHAVHT